MQVLGGEIMDVFFNKTVTIYNLAQSDDVMEEESWYPTVLHNVRVIETAGQNRTTSGNSEADAAKLHIMLDNLEKPYLKPISWSKELDKESYFTALQEHDFFVVGDTSIEDCTMDNFFNYMKENYDSVYKITTVDSFEVIPHLEIGGR